MTKRLLQKKKIEMVMRLRNYAVDRTWTDSHDSSRLLYTCHILFQIDVTLNAGQALVEKAGVSQLPRSRSGTICAELSYWKRLTASD